MVVLVVVYPYLDFIILFVLFYFNIKISCENILGSNPLVDYSGFQRRLLSQQWCLGL